MHSHPIRAAVFDIDGTLAMMDKGSGTYAAMPGAVAALGALKSRGLPVVAYTNCTFFPPAHYYPLLANAGLVLAPGHILTPATVAARQLARMGVKRLMVIADLTGFWGAVRDYFELILEGEAAPVLTDAPMRPPVAA
jgi:NagD protein